MEIIPNWHPIFVHFTVSLLSISTVLFVLGTLAPANARWKATCITVARWNLWMGVLITLGTVPAGWYAYNTVNHDGHSHLAMLEHRNWALPTAGFFIGLGLWSFLSRRKEPTALFVLCALIAAGCLATTAYKGGELVFRHGLGVMALPDAEEHPHHHENSDDGEPDSEHHND